MVKVVYICIKENLNVHLDVVTLTFQRIAGRRESVGQVAPPPRRRRLGGGRGGARRPPRRLARRAPALAREGTRAAM